MQRFAEEMINLTTQARMLEMDVQRAKLLIEERITIPNNEGMMRRRLSRVTKCSTTLQDSLKATARAEAEIIEMLNIFATEEQETPATALKAEKERLQLDQLATSGATTLFTLQTLAKEINDKIEFYSSDDDSSVTGNNIRTEATASTNMQEEIKYLRQQLTDITTYLKQQHRASCEPNPMQISTSRMDQHTIQIHPVSARVKRPQPTLPGFDGNEANFHSYWTVFSTVIDGDNSLSLREKALYLRKSLKGKAREHIRGIVLNEYSYNTIVQTLQQSYKSHVPDKWRVYTELIKLRSAGNTAAEAQEKVRQIRCLLDQLSVTGIYGSNEVAWITTIIHQFPPTIAEKLFQETDVDRNIGTVMAEIEKQVTALTQIEAYRAQRNPRPTVGNHDEKRNKKSSPFNKVKPTSSTTSLTCRLCEKPGHKSYQCRSASTADDRRKIVKEKRLCWKCFTNEHDTRECKMANCPHCEANHHGSLCSKKPKESFKSRETVATITHANKTCSILMTAEVYSITEGKQTKLNAFFDSGATRSFITQAATESLNLKPLSPKSVIKTGGLADNKSQFHIYQVKVSLKNYYEERFDFKVNTAPVLTQPRAATLTSNDLRFISQQNVQIATTRINGEEIKPDIIIGMDYYHNVVYGTQQRLPPGLFLQATAFGMAICGSIPETESYDEMINTIIEESEKEEKRMIQQMFEIGSISINTSQGTFEKADEFFNQYASSISFANGIVTAPLPLKPIHSELKNNYRVAGRTLYTLFNSFGKKPEQLIWYKRIIKDYLKQGIVEVAPPRTPDQNNYFMPDRGVWKENKPTPLRIVFNAQQKLEESIV